MNEPYSLVHIRRIDLCAVFSQILTMSWHICRGAFSTIRTQYVMEHTWIRRITCENTAQRSTRRISMGQCGSFVYVPRLIVCELKAPRHMCQDIVRTCENTAQRSTRRMSMGQCGSFIYVPRLIVCVLNAPRRICHDIVRTCENTAHISTRRVSMNQCGSFIYDSLTCVQCFHKFSQCHGTYVVAHSIRTQ